MFRESYFFFSPWPEEYQPFKVWQRRHRTVQRGDGCPFHRRRREDFGIHQRSLEKLVISLPCFSIFSQICWSVTSSACRLHTHIYVYIYIWIIYIYTCNYCTYNSWLYLIIILHIWYVVIKVVCGPLFRGSCIFGLVDAFVTRGQSINRLLGIGHVFMRKNASSKISIYSWPPC